MLYQVLKLFGLGVTQVLAPRLHFRTDGCGGKFNRFVDINARVFMEIIQLQIMVVHADISLLLRPP
jgi:hypothetical protein